jgi:hypothetical protein
LASLRRHPAEKWNTTGHACAPRSDSRIGSVTSISRLTETYRGGQCLPSWWIEDDAGSCDSGAESARRTAAAHSLANRALATGRSAHLSTGTRRRSSSKKFCKKTIV